MPLSTPSVSRRHYHTRRIESFGYHRDDGLWDIEAHMTDTKTYGFDSTARGHVPAGEPVHDMWLRVTIDDDLLIHGVEAATDDAPYDICGDITPSYEKLIGVRIGPGFRKSIRSRLGSTAGCTHLSELLNVIATVAYQTAYASREKARADAGLPPETRDPSRRPGHLNTCHALATDGPVVQAHWPQFHESPDET